VVHASVALAWCSPDEASEYADGVLVALKGRRSLFQPYGGSKLPTRY
jgi:hypothetical protein